LPVSDAKSAQQVESHLDSSKLSIHSKAINKGKNEAKLFFYKEGKNCQKNYY
jgi:hypothetical protein